MAHVLPGKGVKDDGGGNGLDAGELGGGRGNKRLQERLGGAEGKRQNDGARVDFFPGGERALETLVPPSDLGDALAETDFTPYFLREPFHEPAHSTRER
jgi:hypothetical protein